MVTIYQSSAANILPVMKKFARILSIVFATVWFCTGMGAVYASEIARIDIGSTKQVGQDNQIRIQITGEDLKAPKLFSLPEDKPRLVLDFPNTKLNARAISQIRNFRAAHTQSIRNIRYAVRGQTDLRLVFDLQHKTRLLDGGFQDGAMILTLSSEPSIRKFISVPYPRISPLKKTPDKFARAAPVQNIKSLEGRLRLFNGVPYPRLKPTLSVKPKVGRKPVIVIDPGHGGHDPGAIGVAGLKEEWVTLNTALELEKQLLKTGRYKVILTRSDDRYIAHAKRVRIARKSGADLFLSIHADSSARKKTRGASVYTLADRATQRSKRIVNSQNWIFDIDLAEQSAPVGDILVDLAQRKTRTESERFADIMIANLSARTKLVGNTHRRAGYFVLLAPDVPAVLLEMGFLSNAKDEKLLRASSHRTRLMRGVVKSIDQYFNTQTH